ncbi:MAG TPA: metallophosphoesterase family protein [Casimicrobiaceae bacterium]|nr:metallophosphoesterase family protein [Casimicrobiaceae bacterium]
MRVLLLSDTHGQLDARIAELAIDCDVIVHAGDVGNTAVLDALRARGAEIFAVRGNNDVAAKWPRGERRELEALEHEAHVDLPGGTLIAVHGDRYAPATRHARLRSAYPTARAVVYGHSHRLVIDESAMPWILNPGAAGRARTYGGPSCLVLEARPNTWRVEPHRFVSAR